MYNKIYESEYNNIIISFTKFINYLIDNSYHILFLPFNTNQQNPSENDILIHQDIINNISDSTNFTFIDSTLDSDNIFNLLDLVDICIPMRFHACLYSIYKCIPFVPIYTTRKIDNLLLDIDWTIKHKMTTNNKFIPIILNENLLIQQFEQLKEQTDLQYKLSNVNNMLFNKSLIENTNTLISLIINSNSKIETNSISLSLLTPIDKKIISIYQSVQSFSQSKGYTDFRLITELSHQDIVTNIVSYYLTDGIINSPYTYGLKNKMFNINYNYIEEWKWVINDNLTHTKPKKIQSNPCGLFNINYIDQMDSSGSHRSGWQYVYENIKFLHNKSSNLLLDLYLDRTFHWNSEINKYLNIIPYTRNWIGFIHHTFDTSFSDYNCYNLLKSKEFLDSLKYCKGLFVLSHYLKNQFDTEFSKLGLDIKVFTLVHPTEINVPQFTLQKFQQNNDKLIIHIGGWLRNVYSFYSLQLPKTLSINYTKKNILFNKSKTKTISLRKVSLKGKSMNNYYPLPNFIDELHSVLQNKTLTLTNINKNVSTNVSQNISTNVSQNISTNISQNISNNISQNISNNVSQNISNNIRLNDIDFTEIKNSIITNNWYKHFYEDILFKLKSVDFIEHLENDNYDKILSENIVYINLVDASAALVIMLFSLFLLISVK